MVYYKRSISRKVEKRPEPNKPKMLNTVKEGFAFGIGSSIANNMVSRLFNSSKTDCSVILEEYKQCINNYKNDCEKLLIEYEKCK